MTWKGGLWTQGGWVDYRHKGHGVRVGEGGWGGNGGYHLGTLSKWVLLMYDTAIK